MNIENIWSHNDLSLEVRYATFDWLLHLATTGARGPNVSVTCVRFALNVIDRYMQACAQHAYKLDLRFIATTSLFLAAKMFSPKYPDPLKYADIVRLSVEELLVMEMEVLRQLDFRLFEGSNSYSSAVRYLRLMSDTTTPTLNHAFVYFADLSMLDWHLHSITYSDLEMVTRAFLADPTETTTTPWMTHLVSALEAEKHRNKKRKTALTNRHLGKPYMLKVVDTQLQKWLDHFVATCDGKKRKRGAATETRLETVLKRSKLIEVQKTIVAQRCQGKTVKGTRCKRWAKNKTDFCRLHM